MFSRIISCSLYLVCGLCFLTLSNTVASAQKIAIFAPLSGDYAELGQKFRIGAELAVQKFGNRFQLEFIDDACDPDVALQGYKSLPIDQIVLIGGFLCNDAAIAVATASVGTGIPIVVNAASSIRLIKDRKREQWNLWRVAPGDDYPVKMAAQAIRQNWRQTPYAIVDDGTIYGRAFTDTLRLYMNELGLAPQFSDTFRAAQSTQAGLLRRLERSGITAVLIASTSTEDLFTIARDMNRLKINLELITTEAMMVLPFMEEADQIAPGLKIIGWPIARSIPDQ